MNLEPSTAHKRKWLTLAVFALALSIATGVVFAAWVNNGPEILLSLGASALAWCF
jgi:hypothetical protein